MKRLFTVLLCVLMLSIPVAALAAGNADLQIINCRQNEENALDIILYANKNSIISASNFSVKLDDTDLPVEKIEPLSESQDTSWIVVLEPAPYSSASKLYYALVEGIITNMGKNDNLAVINASTRQASPFVQYMSDIRKEVEAAASAYPKDNSKPVCLYDSIDDAFDIFQTNKELNARKCLIVVTCIGDKNSSVSRDEILKKAKETSVTIYTVGINRGAKKEAEDVFNRMTPVSAATAGGYSNLIDAKEYDEQNVSAGKSEADKILKNEKKFYKLTANISNLAGAARGTLYVSQNGNQVSLENVEILAVNNPDTCEHEWEEATCQQARHCLKCGLTEGEPAEHLKDKSGHCEWCGIALTWWAKALDWVKDNLIISIMGVVLLALLIFLLVVVLKRRKGQVETEEVLEPLSDTVCRVTVELTNKVTGQRFTGEIFDNSLLAGLESPFQLSGDAAISRKHMEFIWQNGILFVQDANSKNGTFVNGKKVTGATQLNQNDLLHAGESDFYVTWRTN